MFLFQFRIFSKVASYRFIIDHHHRQQRMNLSLLLSLRGFPDKKTQKLNLLRVSYNNTCVGELKSDLSGVRIQRVW